MTYHDVEAPAEPVVEEPSPVVGRWWRVARVVIVLIWVLASATSWWTAPREQDFQQLRTDLATNQLAAYRWGRSWDGTSRQWWFDNPVLRPAATLGPLFAWRTESGQVRWIDTSTVPPTGTIDATGYSGAGAVEVAKLLRATGRVSEQPDINPAGRYLDAVAPLLGVLLIVVLAAGPAPVLGTRWFWFFVSAGVPYGIGLLFWVFRERPWASPHHRPATRWRGWRGLLTAGITSTAAALLLVGLHRLLGDFWIPRPGD